MDRLEAIGYLKRADVTIGQEVKTKTAEALEMAIETLEQEPRKITLEDVKGYCKPRCLTIITNELLYELTHSKIKALEQEPCEDCISRQAVNTLVDELARAISDERCYMSRGRSTATIMQDILDLPSVSTERTGHWIPVSERLPEKNRKHNTFLVTDSNGNLSISKFYLPLSNSDIDRPYWSGMIDVIAWMPLPESCEPQERSKE